MTPSTFKQCALSVALAGLALASLPAAAESTSSDQWAFTLTPYLWLPTINGSLKYTLPNTIARPEVETGPNDYLSNLDFAMMISGEARKDKWSIFSDLIYLDFGNSDSHVKSFGGTHVNASVDLGTKSSLSGGVWTLVGGYAAVQQPKATLDVIGGFRYLKLKASTDWTLSAVINDPVSGNSLATSGSISQNADLWDAIVGVRGRVKLGDGNWSMPYYADIGTGSSSQTWQAMVGVAYSWNWGDVGLVYRHLAYDMGDNKLLQNIEFSGPALGASFHF
jgi:hypothetical protein